VPSLRHRALELLQITDPLTKAERTRAATTDGLPDGADQHITEPGELPGRPVRPALVPPSQLRQRAVGTREGHAALLHALAHIEHNAINLALDACWRFAGMPAAYYRDWMQVAQEEALHFQLLHAHLASLGCAYGDLPAHDGLWEMVHATRGDVLARMALVPRTLEARGLDASPAVRQRLASIGDHAGAAIIDRILADEIGHVGIGNHWYRHVCEQRGLDPLTTWEPLARAHGTPALRGPFNLEARRAAGFEPGELDVLHRLARAAVSTKDTGR
jgi:uncharacterized ferritin-like protein (DUF455 family)